jgi:hypothetical protein
MLRKKLPSDPDAIGGNQYSEKIMLKQRGWIMIRFHLIGS